MSTIRREQLRSPLSASYALTASYAMNAGASTNTSGLVTTSSFNAFTASINNFTSSINAFTASYNTGSFTGSFTGSLFGTSSWAVSASQTISASYTLSSSYALSSSYTLTASYVNPLQQNVIITGSIYIPDNNHSIYFSGSGAASRLVWNNTDGTLDLGLKGGNVTLQIGQEQVIYVVNKTGADLLESQYKAVRVRRADEGGAQGQRLAIVLAQANNDANSVDTLGIVTENITNNQEGFITTVGLVRGIDTTGTLQGETWVDGDALYLSPTTAGALTKVKPQAPQHTITMGYVVYAHQNQGKIFVKVDNGYELDELHNVRITTASLSSGDLLVYSSSVWINSKQLTGSYNLIGNLQATSFTGSLQGTASWATNALTASYVNTLNQNVVINGNLNVNGTASYNYVTASQLDVGTNFISVNVAEPGQRFGGLKVYDSGSLSHQATASLAWDSLHNHWVYQNASGSTYSGGMLISGPRNTGSLGDEPELNRWFVTRGDGGDHINSTQIFSSGSVHQITGSLSVKGANGSASLNTDALAGGTYLYEVGPQYGGTNNISIDSGLWRLIAFGNTTVNWYQQRLQNNDDSPSINWGTRVAYDSNISSSIDWGQRQLYSANLSSSIDWQNRSLKDSTDTLSIDWENRTLNSSLKWDDSAFYPAGDDSVNLGIDPTNRFRYGYFARAVQADGGFYGNLIGTASFASSSNLAMSASSVFTKRQALSNAGYLVYVDSNNPSGDYENLYTIDSIQVSGSAIIATSFTGSLFGTASYALTASYVMNGGGGSTNTGSLLTTASANLNTITFTKGDGSTFPITVDTGSGGTSGGTNLGLVYAASLGYLMP